MSSYRWPDMSLTDLGARVHEFARRHGHCVVSMHGMTAFLRGSMEVRNADDVVAEFDSRSSPGTIHRKLLDAMTIAITEDTRG